MSPKQPFDIVKEFCDVKKLDQIYEKILLHTYYKEHKEMIERREQSKGPISEDELNAYKDTLLSTTNLEKNLKIAQSEIEGVVSEKTTIIERKYKTKNVIVNIALGIVSSFFYTIILIIIFSVAENQIRPIVRDYFYESNQKVQNTNNK